MSPFQHCDVLHNDDVTLIRFNRHHLLVDDLLVQRIGDELKSVVSRPECRKLIVDFVSVEDLSSLMLGQLVMLRRNMATKKGRMILCGLVTEVREFLDEIMLSQLFDIVDTEADAVAALAECVAHR
jgi:anti-anti-sigma regulatory factor